MGCCGDREKFGNLRAEQKWDYINLSDFKSSSCWAPFSYGILYISLIVSIAVYAVDTFTAINLIAFDRWSGRVKPAIPFSISRWIFAACIILSFLLLIYRWVRAVRVMKAGGLAQSYLDPLAVRIQSVRMGKRGRGWRRFLVFAELTKSKKGADYVALFTYFSFEAWLRVVFAEGPRQVVNALTLYSVMRLNLLPQGDNAAKDGHSPIIQFFVNVGQLADQSRLQAVILFGMLFTLVIWVISAINLALAVLMYILFLWHHVPTADGTLSKYCRRKINDRAEKIIGTKMNKALRREQRIQMGEEKKGEPGVPGQIKRQPTLPVLETTAGEDKLPAMPMLSRTTTTTTLPPYSSSPPSIDGLDRAPTLPNLTLDTKRPPASRSMTANSARSTTSYNSDAPLLSSANDMGYSSSPVSPITGIYPPPMPMNRNMSSSTQGTQRPYGPSNRAPSSQGRRTPGSDYPSRGPPLRTNTGMSNMSTASTGRRPTPGPGPSPLDRSYTPNMPPPPQNSAWPLPSSGPPPVDRNHTPSAPPAAQNFAWPLPSPDSAAPSPRSGPGSTPTSGPTSPLSRNPSTGQGFIAFNPAVHTSSHDPTPAPTSSYSSRGAYRGVTPSSATATSPQDYFSRQPYQMHAPPMPRTGSVPPTQTSSEQQDDYSGSGYDDFLDDYASDPAPQSAPVPVSRPSPSLAPAQPRTQLPPRSATSTPSSSSQSQRSAPPRSATTTPSSGSRSQPQNQQYQALSSHQPTLPQLQQPRSQIPQQSQTRSQTPQSQSRLQNPQQSQPRPQVTQLLPPASTSQQGKHQTLQEQLSHGGMDWRANDGSAAVQGGGSTGVFDW